MLFSCLFLFWIVAIWKRLRRRSFSTPASFIKMFTLQPLSTSHCRSFERIGNENVLRSMKRKENNIQQNVFSWMKHKQMPNDEWMNEKQGSSIKFTKCNKGERRNTMNEHNEKFILPPCCLFVNETEGDDVYADGIRWIKRRSEAGEGLTGRKYLKTTTEKGVNGGNVSPEDKRSYLSRFTITQAQQWRRNQFVST